MHPYAARIMMGNDRHEEGIEGVDLGCGLRRVRVRVEPQHWPPKGLDQFYQ